MNIRAYKNHNGLSTLTGPYSYLDPWLVFLDTSSTCPGFFIRRKHDQTIFDFPLNVISSDRLFGIWADHIISSDRLFGISSDSIARLIHSCGSSQRSQTGPGDKIVSLFFFYQEITMVATFLNLNPSSN